MMDRVIWWTGASVLSAVGILGAVAAFCAVVIAATWLASYYGQRAWNLQANLRRMAQWDKAGRPVWTQVREGHYEMRPVHCSDCTDGEGRPL